MSTLEFNAQLAGVSQYLHGFALSLTRDPESAGDLYQDTIYKALKNSDKFTLGTNFKAWITTIMRNTFINELRRKKISKTTTEPSETPFIINNAGTVDNSGIGLVTIQELQILIDALPQHLSQPFMMFHYGYAYQEIADELDIPLGTVKSRIFFARKELQRKIAVLYPELAHRVDLR